MSLEDEKILVIEKEIEGFSEISKDYEKLKNTIKENEI